MSERKFIFTPQKHSEFSVLSSLLNPEEQNLVMSFIKREQLYPVAANIFELHGRSLVFNNPHLHPLPTYLNGLQIIGACGDEAIYAARDGVYDKDHNSANIIHPVTSENFSPLKEEIFELREIDGDGKLKTWTRPYAPKHGMDKQEAQQRAKNTLEINILSRKVAQMRGGALFIGPTLALNGSYPELKDPNGDNLYFQAYRVPLIPRLPQQLTNTLYTKGLNMLSEKLAISSNLYGKTLRILNAHGLAYMDGHIGNMGILNDETLYITDLGSIKNISRDPQKIKYTGLDIYSFFISFNIFITSLLKQYAKVDTKDLKEKLLLQSLSSFISGYHSPELIQELKNNSEESMHEFLAFLIHNYVDMLQKPHQGFLDSFEQFLSRK